LTACCSTERKTHELRHARDIVIDESRHHYRVAYPPRLRPRLELEGMRTAVIDVSEAGLRFAQHPNLQISLGAAMSGGLTFRCGHEAKLCGRVVRITKDDVAVSLTQGVSFNVIVREQRALRGRLHP
jgi:hypothetical protein